jgi:hypothetical protein
LVSSTKVSGHARTVSTFSLTTSTGAQALPPRKTSTNRAELLQLRRPRRGEDFFRNAFFVHLAVVHEHALGADIAGEAHFVGDQDLPSRANCSTTRSTSLTSSGSSAEVISSHNSTFGRIASERAVSRWDIAARMGVRDVPSIN